MKLFNRYTIAAFIAGAGLMAGIGAVAQGAGMGAMHHGMMLNANASPAEVSAHVDHMLTYSAVGTPGEVSDYLDGFLRKTGADELIVVHQAPGIEDRLRSVTLLAEAMRD